MPYHIRGMQLHCTVHRSVLGPPLHDLRASRFLNISILYVMLIVLKWNDSIISYSVHFRY